MLRDDSAEVQVNHLEGFSSSSSSSSTTSSSSQSNRSGTPTPSSVVLFPPLHLFGGEELEIEQHHQLPHPQQNILEWRKKVGQPLRLESDTPTNKSLWAQVRDPSLDITTIRS